MRALALIFGLAGFFGGAWVSAQELPVESPQEAPEVVVRPATTADIAVLLKEIKQNQTQLANLGKTFDEVSKQVTGLDTKVSGLDSRISELGQAQAKLQQRLGELEQIGEQLEELQRRVTFLERDNAALAEQVRDLSEGSGRRILANLNTDPQLRHQLAQAVNPRAAVKFYNWNGETKRMNVNGSWYNVPPGPMTIPVAYGPVAVTHCDKETPRTFTDWTPADGGFVMVFDVGNAPARATAQR